MIALPFSPVSAESLANLSARVDFSLAKPNAYVLGNGLATGLDPEASGAWLATVLAALELRDTRLTLTGAEGRNLLLVTPPNGKAGRRAIVKQATAAAGLAGDSPAFKFELAMAKKAAEANIDHLGTWNLAQKTYLQDDGLHFDQGNALLLAVMVVNWLEMLEYDEYAEHA